MVVFGGVLGGVLAGLGAIVFACVFAVLAAIHGLTIVTETSAGNDRIESWPDLGLFLNWVGNLFYVFNAAVLCLALAQLLNWLVPGAHAAIVGVTTFLLFPILLLCELEANSAFLPVSRLVFTSLWRQGRCWLLYYAESACLLLAAAAFVAFAGPLMGRTVGTALVGALFAAVAMIYFRLLGRLAWHCSIEAEDEPAPEQGVAGESPVKP